MAGHSQGYTSINQITHLGRVDMVVISENSFSAVKFPREERENPDGRAQTYPTYPVMLSAQAKIKYT